MILEGWAKSLNKWFDRFIYIGKHTPIAYVQRTFQEPMPSCTEDCPALPPTSIHRGFTEYYDRMPEPYVGRNLNIDEKDYNQPKGRG